MKEGGVKPALILGAYMKKGTVVLLFIAMVAFGQFEVISISEGLSEKTRERLWPVFKSGAITINTQEMIIPDQNSLYIQSRATPNDYTKINLKRHKADYFTVYEATANDEIFAYAVVGSDGRFYIFERGRKTGAIQGPVLRHGLTAERMFLLEGNKLVATGAYRPELIYYLDLYKSNSIKDQIKNAKKNFDPLYINHKAYTLSVYDKYLTEIDSGNIIDRIGDNARAYEGLYLTQAVDITRDEVLYLIDNDQGYVIERYTDITVLDSSFEVVNPKYKKFPAVMTMKDMVELRLQDRAYSVPYALYHKEGYLISTFFQAPVRFGDIRPPYYYDISSESGKLLYSGELEYPFLCEDDGDKVFLYVKHEGGWFEADKHFLVGVTVEDLLKDRVSKATIDASVNNLDKD